MIDVKGVVAQLRDTFRAGVTQPKSWRIAQLKALELLLAENEDEIFTALGSDLSKPMIEAYTAEISQMNNEVGEAIRELSRWMAPKRVKTPLVLQPGMSEIVPQALGVVCIIGPWNYPFQLLLSPLVGALAAGNCAVLKPSEVAPATSALMAKLVPMYFDTNAVKVVEGGVPETTALLKERFDHIFYTGNGTVGKIVMTAAAQHLTPVTLELGGKSPCVVGPDAKLKTIARRLVWCKFYNAGQTCVAPDYVLVDETVKDKFVDAISHAVTEFYGEDPAQTSDYGRIVNGRHHDRLTALLAGQNVLFGGEHDREQNYIAPTLLDEPSLDSAVMRDEIFGPILPIISFSEVADALEIINSRPKPLALYVFSEDRTFVDNVLSNTTSGGATVNHGWIHLAVPELPFGGVGPSGMGSYHSKATFDTFSHFRSVLHKSTIVDPTFTYPPYTASKEKWLKRLL
jgi:aldehyde dehydrogenase (NAD+)